MENVQDNPPSAVGRIDDPGRFVPDLHQRPGDADDADRLPVPVQDQRRTLEDCGNHGEPRRGSRDQGPGKKERAWTGVFSRPSSLDPHPSKGWPRGIEPPPSASQADVQKPLHHGHHVLQTRTAVDQFGSERWLAKSFQLRCARRYTRRLDGNRSSRSVALTKKSMISLTSSISA